MCEARIYSSVQGFHLSCHLPLHRGRGPQQMALEIREPAGCTVSWKAQEHGPGRAQSLASEGLSAARPEPSLLNLKHPWFDSPLPLPAI